MKRKTKIIGILALICILIPAILLLLPRGKNLLRQKAELARIQNASYDSIFYSMFPIDHFLEEDFQTYEGISILKTGAAVADYRSLFTLCDATTSGGQEIQKVYLGLDPHRITPAQALSLVSLFPESDIKIFLQPRPLSDWKAMSSPERYLQDYRAVAESLIACPGVKVYPFFAQEWIIADPENYETGSLLKEDVARRVYLYALFSEETRDCHIREDEAAPLFEAFDALISAARSGKYVFPDLSGKTIVFLGDSVIGNFTDRRSIPGLVGHLSGAVTYNCGWGGGTAGENRSQEQNWFLPVAKALSEGSADSLPDTVQASIGIRELFSAKSPDSLNSETTVFVLHYGLNDYLQGIPVEPSGASDVSSFLGGMKTGIDTLRQAYPNASFLIIIPNHIFLCQRGTECNGELGSPLEDYATALIRFAEESRIPYVDDYHQNIQYEKSYVHLDDGIHPNDYGRFQISYAVMHQIAHMFTGR